MAISKRTAAKAVCSTRADLTPRLGNHYNRLVALSPGEWVLL